jgi:hypothetical protein
VVAAFDAQNSRFNANIRVGDDTLGGLRFQRLMDAKAGYDQVANALWLQARKVGPLKGDHTASIIGIIESSKDRDIDSNERNNDEEQDDTWIATGG